MPKRCSKCGIEKAREDFSTRKRLTASGINEYPRSRCRDCEAQNGKDWRSANPQKSRKATLRWRENNPEICKAIDRRRRYKRLGVTLEEAMHILEGQNFRCANPGCNILLNWGRGMGSMALDHDHITGHVRGFLCQACNKALGYLKDEIGRIQGLAEYLNIKGHTNAIHTKAS